MIGIAMMINGDAPGALAAATGSLSIPIVHLSTDYVFSGGPMPITCPIYCIGLKILKQRSNEKRLLLIHHKLDA